MMTLTSSVTPLELNMITDADFFTYANNMVWSRWSSKITNDLDGDGRRTYLHWNELDGNEIVLRVIRELRDLHAPMRRITYYSDMFCAANGLRGLGLGFLRRGMMNDEERKIAVAAAFDKVIAFATGKNQ